MIVLSISTFALLALVGVAPYVAMSVVAWKKYKSWRGKR